MEVKVSQHILLPRSGFKTAVSTLIAVRPKFTIWHVLLRNRENYTRAISRQILLCGTMSWRKCQNWLPDHTCFTEADKATNCVGLPYTRNTWLTCVFPGLITDISPGQVKCAAHPRSSVSHTLLATCSLRHKEHLACPLCFMSGTQALCTTQPTESTRTNPCFLFFLVGGGWIFRPF